MIKSISEKISELRKARSLTQEQLGLKLGISGQAVSKWEKGESMPDIMLLPKLCDILGVSVDVLLEMPISLRNKNIIKDFCEYAVENDISQILLEVLSKLFYSLPNAHDNMEDSTVLLALNCLRVYDGSGMGFVIGNEKMMKYCLDTDIEDAVFNLKILADENCLSVLRCVSLNNAVTLEEISSLTGLDNDTVYKLTFALIERHFIICDIDDSGKRGYLQGTGMAGAYMILAGCRTLSKEGALQRFIRFTRSNCN